MSAPHVEVGNKVIVSGDPMIHVVAWANKRVWDSACDLVIENYQPAYYEDLLEVDRDAMEARLYTPHPEYYNPDDEDYNVEHPALQLQVAPDDAPVTCLLCLRVAWRLGGNDMIDEEYEEDDHVPQLGP